MTLTSTHQPCRSQVTVWGAHGGSFISIQSANNSLASSVPKPACPQPYMSFVLFHNFPSLHSHFFFDLFSSHLPWIGTETGSPALPPSSSQQQGNMGGGGQARAGFPHYALLPQGCCWRALTISLFLHEVLKLVPLFLIILSPQLIIPQLLSVFRCENRVTLEKGASRARV